MFVRLAFITIAVALLLSTGVLAQTGGADGGADLGPISEAYLAKPDTDGKAGEPARVFATTDVPIFCVVRLASAEAATVKMSLVAVAVPGVKPETNVIATSYATKEGETIINFTGRPHGKWVAGKYRADIFVQGELVTRLEFDITGSPVSVKGASFGPSPPLTAKPKTRRKN